MIIDIFMQKQASNEWNEWRTLESQVQLKTWIFITDSPIIARFANLKKNG